MPTENYLPILDEVAAPAVEWTSPVHVAYDDESNSVNFFQAGRLMHAWTPDRPDARAIADLFLTLTNKAWATLEIISAAATIVLELCDKAPGQVTLQDELVLILRGAGNRWMTTGELAAEVNRRGRHWKTYRNRITAAKVLGRTKLYARTFERVGERVRLTAE